MMKGQGIRWIFERSVSWKQHRQRPSAGGVGCAWPAVPALLFLLAVAAPAAYGAKLSIDCSDTSDFCTGNPCVTADNLFITVPSCTLDFAGADLRIERKVVIPNGGSLSLTAASIEVNGKISGKHTKPTEGDGADVALISPGNITVTKKMDVSGRATPGSILIDAAGNIVLEHKLRARTKGKDATAPGGTITIAADGTVSSNKRAKIEVRGKKNETGGGVVQISGDAGVDLEGRIDARGLFAGSVTVTSAAGNVNIEEEIRAYGEPSTGGTVDVSAPAGSITVAGKKGEIDVSGGLPGGGGIATMSAAATVDVKKVDAGGSNVAPGGAVTTVGESVALDVLLLRGSDGGTAQITSTSGNVELGKFIAEGRLNNGGTVTVDAAADAIIASNADISGFLFGGEARFQAGNNIVLSLKIKADGFAGGVIEAQAPGDITVGGRYSAEINGCIGFVAGGTLTIDPGTTFSPAFQTALCP